MAKTTIGMSPKAKSVLAELKTLASQPLSNATAMPKDLYVSPEILTHEIERLFYSEWICAGRSDEIGNPGDYMSFDLCDQPLILVRKAAGGVHAMSNVCRHRMMRLVDGRGNTKKFTCPYHAWTYDINGRLMAAPYMDRTDCFDKLNIYLPHVRCEEFSGWIYVSLNPDISSIADMLEPLSNIIAPYQMQNYVTIFQEQHEWDCNWKCLTENFMESYHLPVAHKGTVGAHYVVMDTSFDDRGSFEHFTYQLFTKSDGAPVGNAHPDNRSLEGKWRNISVMPTVFPGHMFVLAPDHLWYLCLQPLGSQRVAIKYGAAVPPEVLAGQEDVEAFVARTKAFLDRVQVEDRDVVEGIFRGAMSPLGTPGPLSWLERENHEFTQYLARRLCD
jgi:choline monooxygenase